MQVNENFQLSLKFSTEESLNSAFTESSVTPTELMLRKDDDVGKKNKRRRGSSKNGADAKKPKLKCPEDIFRRTIAKPSLYWMPKI